MEYCTSMLHILFRLNLIKYCVYFQFLVCNKTFLHTIIDVLKDRRFKYYSDDCKLFWMLFYLLRHAAAPADHYRDLEEVIIGSDQTTSSDEDEEQGRLLTEAITRLWSTDHLPRHLCAEFYCFNSSYLCWFCMLR